MSRSPPRRFLPAPPSGQRAVRHAAPVHVARIPGTHRAGHVRCGRGGRLTTTPRPAIRCT